MKRLRVIVVLGAFGYEATWAALAAAGRPLPPRRPRFAHGLEVACGAAHDRRAHSTRASRTRSPVA